MPWAMRPLNSLCGRPLGVGVERVEVAGQGGEGDQVGLGDRAARVAEAAAVLEPRRSRARGCRSSVAPPFGPDLSKSPWMPKCAPQRSGRVSRATTFVAEVRGVQAVGGVVGGVGERRVAGDGEAEDARGAAATRGVAALSAGERLLTSAPWCAAAGP